jgi:2-succinyl-6-hydroxy-2,4-cyclohexadiene-1-carboxylate synthase
MWMLLHGFTGSPRSWSDVLTRMQPDPPRLIPTLLGHDPRRRPIDAGSFEGEVSRLFSIASSLQRPRLLCGYSMGARVALGLLAHRPQFFDAAVLIGVQSGLSDETARAERREVDAIRARSLREEGVAAFVAAWEALPLFASQSAVSPELLDEQRSVRLSHDAEGLARSLEVLGLAQMPDYGAAMGTLDVPITLMAGSLDTKFSGIAHTLAEGRAHIDAHIVDGVGHNVLLEAPAAVATTLKRIEERMRR